MIKAWKAGDTRGEIKPGEIVKIIVQLTRHHVKVLKISSKQIKIFFSLGGKGNVFMSGRGVGRMVAVDSNVINSFEVQYNIIE